MSANLIWRPFKSEGKVLNDSLKYILQSSEVFDISNPVIIDEGYTQYFQGIVDTGGEAGKEAKKVIYLIKKYGSIELSLQY